MMVAIAEVIGITAVISLLIWWAVWWLPKQFDKAPAPVHYRYTVDMTTTYQGEHGNDNNRYMTHWELFDMDSDDDANMYLGDGVAHGWQSHTSEETAHLRAIEAAKAYERSQAAVHTKSVKFNA